jgi:hypothetical protein
VLFLCFFELICINDVLGLRTQNVNLSTSDCTSSIHVFKLSLCAFVALNNLNFNHIQRILGCDSIFPFVKLQLCVLWLLFDCFYSRAESEQERRELPHSFLHSIDQMSFKINIQKSHEFLELRTNLSDSLDTTSSSSPFWLKVNKLSRFNNLKHLLCNSLKPQLGDMKFEQFSQLILYIPKHINIQRQSSQLTKDLISIPFILDLLIRNHIGDETMLYFLW